VEKYVSAFDPSLDIKEQWAAVKHMGSNRGGSVEESGDRTRYLGTTALPHELQPSTDTSRLHQNSTDEQPIHESKCEVPYQSCVTTSPEKKYKLSLCSYQRPFLNAPHKHLNTGGCGEAELI